MSKSKKISLSKGERTRKAILAAAIEIFKEKGLANTSIKDVTDKAGISTGTIYIHFNSKDDLFIKSVEEILDKTLEKTKEHLRPIKNPLEKIFSLYDKTIELLTQDASVAKMLFIDINLVQTDSFAKEVFPAYFRYTNYINKLCKEAIDKGFVRDVDVEALTNMIFGCIDYIIRIWVYKDFKADIKTLKNSILNILVYGIIRY